MKKKNSHIPLSLLHREKKPKLLDINIYNSIVRWCWCRCLVALMHPQHLQRKKKTATATTTKIHKSILVSLCIFYRHHSGPISIKNHRIISSAREGEVIFCVPIILFVSKFERLTEAIANAVSFLFSAFHFFHFISGLILEIVLTFKAKH